MGKALENLQMVTLGVLMDICINNNLCVEIKAGKVVGIRRDDKDAA